MTRVLVAVASRHGATYDIATRIAERLRERNLHVVVSPPDRVVDLEHFDAALVGSAVYAGQWMGRARNFVASSADLLEGIPVWFFSSGPLGPVDSAADAPADVERLIEMTGALDHHVFSGRLDGEGLGVVERIVARSVDAPYGDFRNWGDVDAWADAIGSELSRRLAARRTDTGLDDDGALRTT